MTEPEEFKTDVHYYRRLGSVKVERVESVIPNPFVKFWRHPVTWWKLRHLRHDVEELEDEDSPLSRRVNEDLERAVLCGDDLGH